MIAVKAKTLTFVFSASLISISQLVQHSLLLVICEMTKSIG